MFQDQFCTARYDLKNESDQGINSASLPGIGESMRWLQLLYFTTNDSVETGSRLSSKPRVVSIPADLRKAFVNAKSAAAAFKELSYSRQKEFVDWIESAKKEETRRRRVEQTISMLQERKRLKT
jgi:uncharacterized protein YdeI (YjbR/CyaY-like superfamily)